MTELAKSFDPAAIEAHWGPLWEESGVYEPTLAADKPSFCIQLPPPNVTGTLHMGHAFQHTIMDALVRHHRMKGENTLWVPGTHSVLSPCMRRWRTSASMIVCWNACPMCSVPVTFGGGSWMQNEGFAGSSVGS